MRLRLTKQTEYALRALLWLAGPPPAGGAGAVSYTHLTLPTKA